MKTNYILVCFAILALIGCKSAPSNTSDKSDETSSVSSYKIPPKATVTDYDNNTKLVVIATDDKKGEERGLLVNGKKHGTWTVFNKDGYPKVIRSYMNGQKHGSTYYLDARARVKKREDYVANKLNGQIVGYGTSQIVMTSNHLNDVLEGSYTRYYPNGELMEESNYTNGLKNGESTYYAKSGAIKMKYLYKEGKMIKELDKSQ